MRTYLFLFSFLLVSQLAEAQFGKILNEVKSKVTNEAGGNTALGLQEALENGVTEAVATLSAKDGYLLSVYKIDIPADAQQVISKVKMVPGFGDVEEKLVKQMNEAAELAAKKATPIFVNAIKGLTFKDATEILMGNDDAATRYLETSTRKQLYTEFHPIIKQSLEEVHALSYWKTVVDAYNKLPFVKKQNPALDDHVNQKALDGLFGLIEKKESGIRNNVDQRTSKILKDVFAKQDKAAK